LDAPDRPTTPTVARGAEGGVMETPQARLSPTALSLADAARLLSAAAGQRIEVAMLEADVLAGAPTNPDGTINLVHFAAWQVREMSGRED
jgi:hypothetical protein